MDHTHDSPWTHRKLQAAILLYCAQRQVSFAKNTVKSALHKNQTNKWQSLKRLIMTLTIFLTVEFWGPPNSTSASCHLSNLQRQCQVDVRCHSSLILVASVRVAQVKSWCNSTLDSLLQQTSGCDRSLFWFPRRTFLPTSKAWHRRIRFKRKKYLKSKSKSEFKLY